MIAFMQYEDGPIIRKFLHTHKVNAFEYFKNVIYIKIMHLICIYIYNYYCIP